MSEKELGLELQVLELLEVLVKRTRNGEFRNLEEVRRAFEEMVQAGEASPSPSSGDICLPEEQMEIMSEFLRRFGEGKLGYRPEDIPRVPDDPTNALLVCLFPSRTNPDRISVPQSLRRPWRFLVEERLQPAGYNQKELERFYKFRPGAKHHLRELPGCNRKPGVYWVRFGVDLQKTPRERYGFVGALWEEPREIELPDGTKVREPDVRLLLAGPEVLMALMYSPRLLREKVNLTGIQAQRRKGKWDHFLQFEPLKNNKLAVIRGLGAQGAILTAPPFLVEPVE